MGDFCKILRFAIFASERSHKIVKSVEISWKWRKVWVYVNSLYFSETWITVVKTQKLQKSLKKGNICQIDVKNVKKVKKSVECLNSANV